MKALQSTGVAGGLAGALEWSEPVVFDRLREAYGRRLDDEAAGRALARLHCGVWRALIADDMGKCDGLRRELLVTLERLGLGVGCVAEADARALAELNDIVGARFQRCRREARRHRLALVELARRLAPSLRRG
jgi:hypothetical protein